MRISGNHVRIASCMNVRETKRHTGIRAFWRRTADKKQLIKQSARQTDRQPGRQTDGERQTQTDRRTSV